MELLESHTVEKKLQVFVNSNDQFTETYPGDSIMNMLSLNSSF